MRKLFIVFMMLVAYGCFPKVSPQIPKYYPETLSQDDTLRELKALIPEGSEENTVSSHSISDENNICYWRNIEETIIRKGSFGDITVHVVLIKCKTPQSHIGVPSDSLERARKINAHVLKMMSFDSKQ